MLITVFVHLFCVVVCVVVIGILVEEVVLLASVVLLVFSVFFVAQCKSVALEVNVPSL